MSSLQICPKCKKTMRNTPEGPVCWDSNCPKFVSFTKVPLISKTSFNMQRRSGDNPPLLYTNFNTKTFFEEMQYIGSIQSKRNQYFCYQYQTDYLLSTGLKEMTRFNIVTQEEVNEIYHVIKTNKPHQQFTIKELIDIFPNMKFNSPRLKSMKNSPLIYGDERDEIYYITLTCCYALIAVNNLVLRKEGRQIIFSLANITTTNEKNTNIFKSICYLCNINEKTALFELNYFFITVRWTGYRGSLVPYIKEEIDYLNKLIENIPSKQQLDISKIKDMMDYSNRFHRLYDLIEFRNIRNDREEHEFFESRIKSALEIIAAIKHTT